MYYMQAAKDWLIDLNTYQFVNVADAVKRSDIDVPFYLWSTALYKSSNQALKAKIGQTHDIKLNDLLIMLKAGGREATIKFCRKDSDDVIRLELRTEPRAVDNTGNVGPRRILKGVDNYLRVNDERAMRRHHTEIPRKGNANFEHLPELGLQTFVYSGSNNLSYGIMPNQFEVKYNGKKLSGTSYAFLCGTWAVLLGDDLSFDSLCWLCGVEPRYSGGVRHGLLEVDRFAYTVNPYITKLMMLSQ